MPKLAIIDKLIPSDSSARLLNQIGNTIHEEASRSGLKCALKSTGSTSFNGHEAVNGWFQPKEQKINDYHVTIGYCKTEKSVKNIKERTDLASKAWNAEAWKNAFEQLSANPSFAISHIEIAEKSGFINLVLQATPTIQNALQHHFNSIPQVNNGINNDAEKFKFASYYCNDAGQLLSVTTYKMHIALGGASILSGNNYQQVVQSFNNIFKNVLNRFQGQQITFSQYKLSCSYREDGVNKEDVLCQKPLIGRQASMGGSYGNAEYGSYQQSYSCSTTTTGSNVEKTQSMFNNLSLNSTTTQTTKKTVNNDLVKKWVLEKNIFGEKQTPAIFFQNHNGTRGFMIAGSSLGAKEKLEQLQKKYIRNGQILADVSKPDGKQYSHVLWISEEIARELV